jgi:hypothetical protein
MSSYTKWDRAGYLERVGGEEEAERRRKVLMARQSGYRLAEERKRRGLTQAQLAQAMRVSAGRVSQIERGKTGHDRRGRPLRRSTRRTSGTHRQLRRPHPHRHHHRSRITRSASRSQAVGSGRWPPANVIHAARRPDLAAFQPMLLGFCCTGSARGRPATPGGGPRGLLPVPAGAEATRGWYPGPTLHHLSRLRDVAGLSDAELDALVERATVDAYDEYEQLASFHVVIEEHLAVPFRTTVLGAEVTVTKIDLLSGSGIVAICSREKHRQAIGILDLPLPTPRPAGAEWIDAYRRWAP